MGPQNLTKFQVKFLTSPQNISLDILPMPKGRGFWIQAEIANIAVGLISPSPRVDAPTHN